MVIGIDASRANNDKKTGVEWYAWHVIEELKKIIPAEHRVILYTREPLKGDLSKLPLHWVEQVLHWPPRRLWSQLRLSWEMWRRPPDLFFVPAHVLPWFCPPKTVLTIHDLGGFRFPQGYSLFERRYHRFSNRLALKRAMIITVSNFCRREILSFFKKADPNRVKVIYNGYDKERYNVIPAQAGIQKIYSTPLDSRSPILVEDKLHGNDNNSPYFITISRLEEKKNTLGLVQAFEMFLKNNPESEGRLVLLGKPGFGFDKVAAAISASPFKDRIIVPGWVSIEEAARLMAGAAALVFPSFYEGFGIPVLEAMACGVPVIASNTAALPEICDQAAILINPNKLGEIAAAMKQVQDPVLRHRLIEAGFQRAAEFSWQKCASELWQVFKSRACPHT